jgi:hypothetical protein
LRSTSINEVALRSRSFDRHKVDLQGKLMRELHGLQYLLPRPIPSVGENGALAPVWAHARLRFPKRAGRDVENYRTLVSKALGDALTGPFTRWVGSGPSRRLVDADRTLLYRGRAYKGRWLEQDTDRHWLLTMDFDPAVGPARLLVWLVWDEPEGLTS